MKRRSRSRSHENDEDSEQRRLEKIRKDKEGTYMEKLKEWEQRERKKARDYEKQFSKEERKKNEEEEEKHRLLEFLEDYDDDRDDVKYYKDSSLARRMRDRELEAQADARDRQRELEEMEDVLRKQMSGEIERPASSAITPSSDTAKSSAVPTPTETPTNNHVETAAALRPTFSSVSSSVKNEQSPAQPDSSPGQETSPAQETEMRSPSPEPQQQRDNGEKTSADETSSKKFGFGMRSNTVANKNKLDTVFNSNEDDTHVEDEPKKKPLSRLNDTSNDKAGAKDAPSVEDKRKLIKNLIEKIPTVKEELFAFPLKWDIVDQSLVDKRIKPWVNKKIFEYIGEEEETLVDFICSKVLSKCNAKRILEDVAMVLDEESEVFVVKMWRLLIYETEAKCLGLVK